MKMKLIQSKPKQSEVPQREREEEKKKAKRRRRCDGWGGNPDAAGGGLRHREGKELESPSIRISLRSVALPLFPFPPVVQTEFC